MSANVSIEQSLMRAKLHIKKSEIEEAKKKINFNKYGYFFDVIKLAQSL